MEISSNKVVSLSYTLYVNDEIVDKAEAKQPLQFIFGQGMLLQDFENNIAKLSVGEKFDFRLTAEQGYGTRNPEYILKLPKAVFEREGEVAEDLLVVGNRLPMMDQEGNRMDGLILEVTDAEVIMDFNHPLAGEDLHFKGEIIAVREATPEELEHGHVHNHSHNHKENGDGCCENCSC